MPDVLIFGDTLRSPELRHEVPAPVADPFLYVEVGGSRHVVIPSMEIPIVREVGSYELHPFEEFGVEELRRTSSSPDELVDEIAVRATRAFGVESALVPGTFPLATAGLLKAAGIELTADREFFFARRRSKSGAELAGIRRAQVAAEAGMAAARDLLRQAGTNADGELELDGAPLTSERIKEAISARFMAHGATFDEFVVSHGPQAAIGHHLGHGHIRAGETIVIDIWPQDAKSSCFADMTRTFVVGQPSAEVESWHRVCREVLDRAVATVRPGITGRELFALSCELFESEGFPTMRTKVEGETLEEGFFHSLGHGVGLEAHEAPLLGLVGKDPLVPGDVIAIEPGLYRPGLGGVRLEDLVRVTDDGAEPLTQFSYDLAP